MGSECQIDYGAVLEDLISWVLPAVVAHCSTHINAQTVMSVETATAPIVCIRYLSSIMIPSPYRCSTTSNRPPQSTPQSRSPSSRPPCESVEESAPAQHIGYGKWRYFLRCNHPHHPPMLPAEELDDIDRETNSVITYIYIAFGDCSNHPLKPVRFLVS